MLDLIWSLVMTLVEVLRVSFLFQGWWKWHEMAYLGTPSCSWLEGMLLQSRQEACLGLLLFRSAAVPVGAQCRQHGRYRWGGQWVGDHDHQTQQWCGLVVTSATWEVGYGHDLVGQHIERWWSLLESGRTWWVETVCTSHHYTILTLSFEGAIVPVPDYTNRLVANTWPVHWSSR